MNVLEGPRREQRRVFHGGTSAWVTVDGDQLVFGDGRRIGEAHATYLAPCEPTKILCLRLNYDSRRVEFRARALATPTDFQKPTTRAE
jgi:5-oxopent-3-ene-1,2,5-tricarboxylate decarboxylase/2-hydroxyhepta-2,4-diene-1,7-dioate isomerase